MLLWFGWFGFNPGSAFAAGKIASNGLLVTQVAAAASGLIWGLLSWKRSGKLSTIAAISGAVAGLAGVTPMNLTALHVIIIDGDAVLKICGSFVDCPRKSYNEFGLCTRMLINARHSLILYEE